MPSLSPSDQFEDLKKKVEETVREYFPVKGRRTDLVLHSVKIEDEGSHGDLRSQKDALRKGKSWTVPVYADMSLQREGKEVDRKRVLVMRLPKTTERFGYIVGGNEYQVLNQLRLKSGVYHRVAPNGDALAEFNLANRGQFANGKSFKIKFDPESALFYLQHRNSNVPLYHLLKSVGVDDDALERSWGRSILNKNREKATKERAFASLFKATTGKKPGADDKLEGLFAELLEKTELRKDTTKKTLGKAYTTVSPEVLLKSSGNLLAITKGDQLADDKASLEFQTIHSVEDLITGHLKRSAARIKRKILNTIDKQRSVRKVVPSDTFNRSLRDFFTTSLVSQPEQVNPLQFISGSLKTTIMGEQGGIKSAYAISEEQKLINPSSLGFLDPVHTPESEKTGISLALPLASKKVGNTLVSHFMDRKTGKNVFLDPRQALSSTVAFPDQFKGRGSNLKPIGTSVKATKNGKVVEVSPKDVDYVIPSARGLFGIATNMIPFLQNNQGNRAMTAARQAEQAVPLRDREAPLVQVKTDKESSFEELIGAYASKSAPISGTVDQVRKDAIIIKDSKGKMHEVQVYRDFPLKGGTLIDSEVKVKAGDKVKEGQLLADTNFTRNGVLALGTNLKTAYLPLDGYNFEDGIVISEKAAKKLTSIHLHPKESKADADTIISKAKFLAQYPHSYKKGQLEHIDEDGLVRIGSVVKDGDPLLLALKKPLFSQQRKQIQVFRRSRPDKFRDQSVAWDKPGPGIVTDIVRKGKTVTVFVKTEEPAQIGDKLVGRHGNKGVITRILPEGEMPYSETKGGDKVHVDIAMNPLGVPGRINLGQVLETAVSKVAAKLGRPVKVRNFESGKNYLEDVKAQLKANGLMDKEVLINPKTGKPLDQKVFFGNQYIFKLKHQIGKKMSARSGAGGLGMPYDINQAPASGAPHGGMTIGELGMYSMLAHGARENLFEMFAYKSNKNNDMWDAIREGTPLPPPKVPFAYEKFTKYLNGLRVNVKKEGNSTQLIPFTEKQVLAMSNGEITEPGLAIRAKDLRPEKKGLFDPEITGGPQGTRWAHFKLSEPMPNPLFEDAIKKLTGLTAKKFNDIVSGKTEVKGKRGGAAFEALLKGIDVKKERAEVEEKIKKAKGAGRNKLHQRLRILRALDENDLDPTVYMMKNVPVMPPVFRPITVKDDGSLSNEDVNALYKDLGAANEALNTVKKSGIPDKHLEAQRAELYDGLKAMTGLGGSLTRQGEYRGIVDIIAGKLRKRGGGPGEGSSKSGFFQQRIMKRRQDFTGRSIIIPEPRMGIDELGVPEKMAWTMYQPFIERRLIRHGFRPLDAIEEVKKKSTVAVKALERAIEERPILLKRDPALHKFNVMAFRPRLVKGKAIEIHPLVTSGYNADFDGDAMSVYLPVTEKGAKEAVKMYPSNNLFSSTTGGVMYTPGHEALLGLYLMSMPGKRVNKAYKTESEARKARRQGDIRMTDVIKVGGHETTAGRLEIESAIPKEYRETGKKKVSRMSIFDKGYTKKLLTRIAKKHPNIYGEVANRFKDLGNDHSTNVGFSIGLDDFMTINVKERDKLIGQAERAARKIRRDKKLSARQKNHKVVQLFTRMDKQLDKINNDYVDKHPTNISKMVDSGSRGSRTQLNQIVSTPTLILDAQSKVVPHLITNSYAEGMDVASYWTTMHGARKGIIQKVQGVRDPGYLSKLITNSTINTLVTDDDCGATDGVSLSVNDHDVTDRYLYKSVRLGRKRYRAGTLVTPDMLSAARKSKTTSVPVRSPLRCKAEHGICKKCMGLSESGKPYETGTNIGVIAAQAVGEPSAQLSMRVFHTGGLAKGLGAGSADMFLRLKQVMTMPKELPNAAPLSLASGNVTQVERAPQGGEYVTVGKFRHYVPANQERRVRKGSKVEKGDALSDGLVDPKRLLPLKGLRKVQDFLSNELSNVMQTAVPFRRRNAEVVVKSMTNVTEIDDPGDHPDWNVGDTRPSSLVQHWNARNKRKGKKEVKHTPVIKGVDVLPNEMQEDWVARLNFQRIQSTLTRAAREGWKSAIHGFHPVPGLARATEFGKGKQRLGEEWKGQY
jgi:DNA-directed RNA polymerase subunit beta'